MNSRKPDISKVMNTSTASTRSARHSRFESIFRAHYDTIRRHAVRCGSSEPDDVAAECFTALWRRLDDVRPELERAWLIATTRKLTANQRRSDARRNALTERIASAPTTVPAVVADSDPAIHAALQTLSSTDRQVLLLAVWDELSVAEIAFVLNLTRSATGVRLFRARKRFAAAYGTQSTEPGMDLTKIIGGVDA